MIHEIHYDTEDTDILRRDLYFAPVNKNTTFTHLLYLSFEFSYNARKQ